MKVKAFAKINLFLEITGKRPDGYHNLVSIMQEISLYDELLIKKKKEKKISVRITGGYKTPLGKNNIVYKSADLMFRKYNINEGIDIRLKKNIPIGAGLGGGSSNAAAVIKAINRLWKLGLDKKALINIGKKIGADVPFFIHGGTCRVKGIGEKITVLPEIKKWWILLIYPNINISTKEIYDRYSFTLTKFIKRCSILKFSNTANGSLRFKDFLFNRLEEPAFTLEPKLKKIKENLACFPSQGALMTGSGSCIYAILESKRTAFMLKKSLNVKDLSIWVLETK
ncbi:4-(cytidine 5'-diphospho)-2-C-methyl-D-erythritol kinase [bacterium]